MKAKKVEENTQVNPEEEYASRDNVVPLKPVEPPEPPTPDKSEMEEMGFQTKVSMPIKVKMITAFGLVLFVGLGVFLYYSLNLF